MIDISYGQLFLIGIGGLLVGSFLNVIVARLHSKETVWFARSRCPFCKKELIWYDLIPLWSFLWLSRRCRFCYERISWQYPIVELATSLLFLVFAGRFARSPFDLAFWLFFAASFIVLTLFDIKFQMIPNEIIWPLVVGAIIYAGLSPFFLQHLASGALTGGFILFLTLATKERGMGMGDVPLAFLQGLLLGWPKGGYALFLSFVIGAAVSVVLLASKRATLKTAVPFAPFLIAGLLIMLFFGM